jgi:uncharacterized protein
MAKVTLTILIRPVEVTFAMQCGQRRFLNRPAVRERCRPGGTMTFVADTPEVTDNTERSRLELVVDGEMAELIYRRRADRLVLVHTGVPEELEGRGLGGQLVRAAIAKAAAEGLTLVPLCPYARGWLERHPEAASGLTVDFGQVADN